MLQIKDGKLKKGDEDFLLRGFGLGGWFLPEGYMWHFYTKCDRPRRIEALIETLCGKNYAEAFWESYYDTYITKEDIRLIREWGFNSIRLPLNARHLYETVNGRPVLQEQMMKRVDRLIDWCREYGIYVIIDMHGAPGGQTGQNIDDSERDYPELFTCEENQVYLIWLWSRIAERYRKEEWVAGYDLLNEPLVNCFYEHYDKLLPLYRKLIKAIRETDENHIIILEGAHWATDFSVFQDFTPEEAGNQIMLQFHKYWSNPDKESLKHYLSEAKRLGVPLYMGEGGENHCDWYTMLFPMLERENISWCFWSYKKMSCHNSPVSFQKPAEWSVLLSYLNGSDQPEQETARAVFDDFLKQIGRPYINEAVFRSLNRQCPVKIPAEAFDISCSNQTKEAGAAFRQSEPVTILFAHEPTSEREPDYKRYGGEKQPKTEELVVLLKQGDQVIYRYRGNGTEALQVIAEGTGVLATKVSAEADHSAWAVNGTKTVTITIICIKGTMFLKQIVLE